MSVAVGPPHLGHRVHGLAVIAYGALYVLVLPLLLALWMRRLDLVLNFGPLDARPLAALTLFAAGSSSDVPTRVLLPTLSGCPKRRSAD